MVLVLFLGLFFTAYCTFVLQAAPVNIFHIDSRLNYDVQKQKLSYKQKALFTVNKCETLRAA